MNRTHDVYDAEIRALNDEVDRLNTALTEQKRSYAKLLDDTADDLLRLHNFVSEVRSILALNHKTSTALRRNIEAELEQLDRKSA